MSEFDGRPEWVTQYEVVEHGTVLSIAAKPAVTKCVRIAVLAEDGMCDYVFDLSFEQALSIAEAILHAARMRVVR